MKKAFIIILAVLTFSTLFGSVQPVKIKTATTVEESIDAYFLALMEAAKCSNDVCRENALAATIGIPTPQSFNDAQLEQKVQDYINNKVSDFYCKIIIGGAYWDT